MSKMKLNYEVLLGCLVFSVFISSDFGNSAPMDDYVNPDKFPKYPLQQYIQVRKSITVEHVPRSYYAENAPQAEATQQSASSPTTNDPASAASHHGSPSSNHVYQNMGHITHDVMTQKKQEVYEEKGYMDSAYDHGSSYNRSPDSQSAADGESSGAREHPLHRELHADGSSTKLLEYAARVLYDRDAHEKGIYEARSGMPCPAITDFKLKGSVRGRQPDGRVTGLGAHIDCQRLKYFGSEPLPRAIFQDPAKSRRAVISMPSMDEFMNDAKRNLF